MATDDLIKELRALEQDYHAQPHAVRKQDLIEINRIRFLLAMPPVDDSLGEMVPTKEEPVVETLSPVDMGRHKDAEAMFLAYQTRVMELKPHQEYAHKVASATNNPGRTPVMPLATMGTNGGQLLCDVCHKPIKMEGQGYNGMTALEAWTRNPDPNFVCYIKGGMVVHLQTNGTLRIYHGYENVKTSCCVKARKEDEDARKAFSMEHYFDMEELLNEFLKDRFPSMDERGRMSLVNDVLATMCSYDPGIGINVP